MKINLGDIALVLGFSGLCSVRSNGDYALICRLDPELNPAEAKQTRSMRVAEGQEYIEEETWSKMLPTGAQIDSRMLRSGDLFFCIKGNNVDGHDFAMDAAKAGASAIIAERDPFLAVDASLNPSVLPPVLLVPNTVEALQLIASYHRDTASACVIGITGTAGKTSVKEVLAHILAVKGRVDRNHMNLNNGIGLPLSMLNADPNSQFWVMEVGISEPKDMQELASILRPNLALILNVGEAHLEGLGDKGVAHYKSQLFSYIQDYGTALYSADYPDLNKAVHALGADLSIRNIQMRQFSAEDKDVFCRARFVSANAGGQGVYEVTVAENTHEVVTLFHGQLGSENTAAIVAAALLAGIEMEDIAAHFSSAVLPKQRFKRFKHGPYTVIDDSYNANPLSARRMLEAAFQLAKENREPLLLVMGEMLELGTGAALAHRILGEQMAAVKPVFVLWKGGHGEDVFKGLAHGGYTGSFVLWSAEMDIAARLTAETKSGGVILYKGSRGNHLEKLVEEFVSAKMDE